jgi:RNA polymerase sigma factor (sigma-70 family)
VFVPHYRADKAVKNDREGQHSGEPGGVVTDANVNQGGEAGTTSLSLLERARARDQAAWSRLVDLYGPLLHRWCLGAGLQPADAADVTQEVFAVVARSIDGFRHDRPGDTFRGWLYSITRNKIRDRLRKGEPAGAGGSDAQRRLASVSAEADPPSGFMWTRVGVFRLASRRSRSAGRTIMAMLARMATTSIVSFRASASWELSRCSGRRPKGRET